jgi:hypothetical protein
MTMIKTHTMHKAGKSVECMWYKATSDSDVRQSERSEILKSRQFKQEAPWEPKTQTSERIMGWSLGM